MRALLIGLATFALAGAACFDESSSPPALLIANETSGSVIVSRDPPSRVEDFEVEIGPGGSRYI